MKMKPALIPIAFLPLMRYLPVAQSIVTTEQNNFSQTCIPDHTFEGLVWYEQQCDDSGKISFIRHMISDDYSEPTAGGYHYFNKQGDFHIQEYT